MDDVLTELETNGVITIADERIELCQPNKTIDTNTTGYIKHVYDECAEYVDSDTQIEHLTKNSWLWKNPLNFHLQVDKYVTTVVLPKEQQEQIARQIQNRTPISDTNNESLQQLVSDRN